MAMNGNALGDEIAKIITDPNATEEMKAKIKQMWEKICGAFVAHIQTNAEVLAGIKVSASGAMGAVEGATTAPGQIK